MNEVSRALSKEWERLTRSASPGELKVMLMTTSAAGRGAAGACAWAACGNAHRGQKMHQCECSLDGCSGVLKIGIVKHTANSIRPRDQCRLLSPAANPSRAAKTPHCRRRGSPAHGCGTWAPPRSAARAAAAAARAHAGRHADPRPPDSPRPSGCAPRSPRCAATR